MSKQSKTPNNPNRVQAVRSAFERRAERRLLDAIHHPETVEDWDDLDFTILEHQTSKQALQ